MNTKDNQVSLQSDHKKLTECYEDLRKSFLSGDYRWNESLGLGTLLRQGMCHWLLQQEPLTLNATKAPAATIRLPSYTNILKFEPLHAKLGTHFADMMMTINEEKAA